MTRSNRILAGSAAGMLALMASAGAQAATVDIQKLVLDNFSGTFSISSNTYAVTQPLSPPAELVMGGYAGSLVSYSSSGIGTSSDLTLESTASHGGNPLSGTADTTAGSLSLDLSSLWLSFN